MDRIEIAESSANSAVLVKEDGKWVIPSSAGFPADGAKVSGLLTKLAGLKKGWPVASSVEAAKRFKVTADAYERRIVLKSGGSELGEILLGSSQTSRPSMPAPAVTAMSTASPSQPTRRACAREDWMDRSLLTIQQDQIASIAIGDAVLERKDGKFVLEGLAKDQKQDETATYRLVGALTYPAFDAVAGKGAEALAKANEPTVEVTIKRSAGDPIVLKYKKEAGGGAYLFTSSANSFLFRASEAAIEPVVKAKRETLIEAPKKAEAEELKKASDEAAQAGAEPLTPEEPKKAEAEGAEAVPAAESKGAEDERFQAAMQPPKPEEPKKAQDEAAPAVPAEEPKKAGDEQAPAAAEAAKPEEPRNATGEGAQVAQPEKPAEPQPGNGG